MGVVQMQWVRDFWLWIESVQRAWGTGYAVLVFLLVLVVVMVLVRKLFGSRR